MNNMEDVITVVSGIIDANAEKLKQEVADYTHHVYGGGDVAKLPNGGRVFSTPISAFMQTIVNAWRASQGIKPNPYHPTSPHYRLFDQLLHARDEGEGWLPAKALSERVYGSRPDTYLKNNTLKTWGWSIEKETINGKVHYRLCECTDKLVTS